MKWIEDLLRFQYNDSEEEICKLLSRCVTWFNKEGVDGNLKMNTFYIIGPPNCGKNYFWDMWAAIAFNTGHIVTGKQ